MKILFITRRIVNRGGQIVLTGLMHKLQEQGYDIHFVAFNPEGREDYPDGTAPMYKGLDVEIRRIKAYDSDAEQCREYIDAAANYLKKNQNKYDRVILDSWYIAVSGVLARCNLKTTFHLVQSDPHFAPQTESKIWESRLFEVLPLFPTQRILVSKNLQQVFKERHGQEYPAVDLYVDDIYRASDFTVRDTEAIRFVASASDFNIPSKGLDFLLESMQRLKKPRSLTLVSGQPIARDLSGFDFPIATAVARKPEEMVTLLRHHDVYLSASTQEAFGLALAEAITLGMPSITVDSVGNRDYAKQGNCIFVENPADLAAAMHTIYSLDVRRKLHKAARPSMAHYRLEEMVAQFKQFAAL